MVADSGEENIVNSVHGEKGANWVNGLAGLSDKEKESFASRNGDAYIEFGEATEGAVEAHNFNSALSVTTVHSSNRLNEDESVASKKTLAESVFSVGGESDSAEEESKKDPEDNELKDNESKDDTMEESEEEGSKQDDEGKEANENKLAKNKSKEEEEFMDARSGEEGIHTEGMDKVSRDLTEKLRLAQSNLDNVDSRGSSSGSSDKSDESNYHKKFEEVTCFKEALWNASGPSVSSS